jgi:hypothetical protein
MLRALLDRYEQRIEHDEMMAGIIAANVANHGYRYPATPVEFTQYMPSQRYRRRLERPQPTKELTPEQWQSKLNRIFGT